jgi:probable phosphoglycerate mutase
MFYAIRHGETDLNKQGIVQGAGTDVPLNDTGRQQAEDVAQRLAELDVAVIFSSDMLRSQQTTEIINAALCRDVFFTPLLRETHYGEIEGMKSVDVDVDERYKHICEQVDDLNNPNRYDVSFPGGESRNAVARRFLTCLQHINHHNKNVLLSSHGGILRSFSCIYNGPDEKIPNCGGLSFDLGENGMPIDIRIF